MRNIPFSSGRRNLMLAGAASAGMVLLPGAVRAAVDTARQFELDLAAFADEIIRRVPEQATSLGLDHGIYLGLKGKLADVSLAANRGWAQEAASMRARLTRIDRAHLSPADQIRHDAVMYSRSGRAHV